MKNFKLICLAVISLVMLACSNDDNENLQQSKPVHSEGIPFRASVKMDLDAQTRALTEDLDKKILKTSWEVGDKVALIHNSVKDEVEVESVSGGIATLAGTLSGSPEDGDEVTVIYPAGAANGTTGNVSSSILNSQDGALGCIMGGGMVDQGCDVRKGTGTLKVKDGETASFSDNVSLSNVFAIVKFTLQDMFGASADKTATGANVGDIVYQNGKFYSLEEAAASELEVAQFTIQNNKHRTIITVTPSSASSTLYVAMEATNSSTQVLFLRASSNGLTYRAMVKSANLSAGYYYQTTAQMAAAEAMVTYKGTAPAGGNGDATCTHGLAWAFQDVYKNSEQWGTWEGNWSATSDVVNAWISNLHPLKDNQMSWRIPTLDDMKYMIEGCGGSAYTSSTNPEDLSTLNYGNIGKRVDVGSAVGYDYDSEYGFGGSLTNWVNTVYDENSHWCSNIHGFSGWNNSNNASVICALVF